MMIEMAHMSLILIQPKISSVATLNKCADVTFCQVKNPPVFLCKRRCFDDELPRKSFHVNVNTKESCFSIFYCREISEVRQAIKQTISYALCCP